METRSLLLSITVATALASASAATAQQAAPDTSEWTCSKCPFDKGYRSEVELGGGYVDDSAAKFGDYTGLDEDGGYVLAGAEGHAATDSGYVLSYALSDLGLDSREASIEGGRPGRYEFGLFYDRIPHRIFDTTSTVFGGVGSRSLTLPGGWVIAGTTGGMSLLDDSLRQVDVGVDRDRYGATGAFWWGQNLSFSLDYRRDERDGLRPQLAAIGSVSTELLRPVDDTTDRLDAKVRYQGSRWFAEVGYSASIYETNAAYLRWRNPFNPMAPGAEDGQMALAPDNDYHELSLATGWYGLPGNTTVGLTAATGKGSQDMRLLPYTVNPLIATDGLPASNLDGELSVTRFGLTVTSRPLDRLRLRGAVTYDERDNDSRQQAYTSIVHTDAFLVADDRINPVYGYERTRVFGSADYEVYTGVTLGAGGEYRATDRTGTAREVKSEQLADGWGRVQYRPNQYLNFVVKGGVEEREPDRYDTDVADLYGQNPLLRKYHMAYRYRGYAEMVANAALGKLPVSIGASAFYADDSYTRSDLGLISSLDRRYALDLTWTINEKFTAYLNGGQEKIDSASLGSSSFATADWRGDVEDEFTTWGGGLTARLGEKARLDLGYTRAEGDSGTTVRGVAGGEFPTVTSELDSFQADFTYGWSERLDLVFGWRYESFDSDNWAWSGIEPDTLATILSLGADPYEYDVNYVTASFRYYFGPRKVALPE